MTNQIQRKIAIKDYYGKGKHVYEDQMGFRDIMKSEARSLVAREVFRYPIAVLHRFYAFISFTSFENTR